MTHYMTRIVRKSSPWLAAGVLVQAGGCNIDVNNLAAGLVQSVVNAFVTDLIFGIFNVGAF